MKKTRNYMYVQQVQYLPFDMKELPQILKNMQVNLQKFAYIIHDKDVDEQNKVILPHLHLSMQFKNPRCPSGVAKDFNEAKVEQFQIWNKNVNNGYSYLIHKTNECSNKFQYSPTEVTANFDYEELIKNIKLKTSVKEKYSGNERKEKVKQIIELYSSGVITLKNVENTLTKRERAVNKTLIQEIKHLHQVDSQKSYQKRMVEEKKGKNTYWLYGASGTGKTLSAKDFAKHIVIEHFDSDLSLNMDIYSYDFSKYIYISGSNRDPWQNYDGQPIIIIDELRPRTIEYNELLRLLDPYDFNFVGGSRYSDKLIVAEYIIITTPYSPSDFYKNMDVDSYFNNATTSLDTFTQLARRLTLVHQYTELFIIPMMLEHTSKGSHFVKLSSHQNTYFKPFETSDETQILQRSHEFLKSNQERN